MREAEKKRLVRLIEEAHKKSAEAIHEHIMDTLKEKGRFNSKTDADKQSIYELEADSLLENGVIVPPCKVGDTICRVVNDWDGCSSIIEWGIEKLVVYVDEAGFVDDSDNWIAFDEFGKTVFLSEAEAKYALKNRRSVSLVNGHIEE